MFPTHFNVPPWNLDKQVFLMYKKINIKHNPFYFNKLIISGDSTRVEGQP
jgi:hypothetical protein